MYLFPFYEGAMLTFHSYRVEVYPNLYCCLFASFHQWHEDMKGMIHFNFPAKQKNTYLGLDLQIISGLRQPSLVWNHLKDSKHQGKRNSLWTHGLTRIHLGFVCVFFLAQRGDWDGDWDGRKGTEHGCGGHKLRFNLLLWTKTGKLQTTKVLSWQTNHQL